MDFRDITPHNADIEHPVPSRGIIVLTCMDVRIDPLKALGLEHGDAHVLRNAGARVTEDVIRSILVSYKLMGTNHVIVMHHTDCGLSKVRESEIQGLVAGSDKPAEVLNGRFVNPADSVSLVGHCDIEFGAFDDQTAAVSRDVYKLFWHPLIPKSMRIDGVILDVKTGKITPVPGAFRPAGVTALKNIPELKKI